MRRIDQLYTQKAKTEAKIKVWQDKCKHKKTIRKYIICIPGASGDFNVCVKCDKMLDRCIDQMSVSDSINTTGYIEGTFWNVDSPIKEFDVRNSDGLERYTQS